MSKINFLALGGLDEKNNHMYILEIDSKIYILDSGIYEPLNSTLGIKHYVPNINYLKENADKIKGVFLSSANRQQIAHPPTHTHRRQHKATQTAIDAQRKVLKGTTGPGKEEKEGEEHKQRTKIELNGIQWMQNGI